MDIARAIILSKMTAADRGIAVSAQNMANASTAGFQNRMMVYKEFIFHPTMGETFSYVNDISTLLDTKQGPYVRTDNPLHAYIKGEGAYFAVQTPQGVRYTRAGAFALDNQSRLVTPDGHLVLDSGQAPIVLTEGQTDISIASDGTISDQVGAVAQLGLFRFPEGADLLDESDTLVNSNQPPLPAEGARVQQYGYEGSNTQSILETQKLLALTREYMRFERMLEEENRLESQRIQTFGKPITT